MTKTKYCTKHGLVKAVANNRCSPCAIENVDRSRKKKKEILVAEHGGRCAICGYDRSIRALQFHHLDPLTKSFTISDKGRSYSLDRLRAEAKKCILVCGNCHMELEDDIINILAD